MQVVRWWTLIKGSPESMKGRAALTNSFSGLGLLPDRVGKHTDVILDYVQSAAGQQTMALLKNALLSGFDRSRQP